MAAPYSLRGTAVGSKGAIRSAKGLDGEWTLEASGENGDLYGVAYSGGRYAIAGLGTFKVSGDGSRWEDAAPEQVDDMTAFYNLYGAKGSFMASGVQFTTTKMSGANLLKSVLSIPFEYFNALAVSGSGTVVAVGDHGMICMSDGKAWTTVASPTFKTLRSVVWDDKRFIAVGEGGVIVTGERK